MTPGEIKAVLESHRNWLAGYRRGSRADLSGAVLSGADLSGADLRRAVLRRADLRRAVLRRADLSGADLSGADLSGAVLSGADLSGADLSGADLSGAVLSGADLSGADLRRAVLRRADLRRADLSGADLPHFQIIPEEGGFIAWKQAGPATLKLRVPARAERTSSLVGRKCRVSEAKVIAAYVDGKAQPKGSKFTTVLRGGTYVVGETATPDSFDPDIRVECTNGLHVFVTRAEAENW